MPSRQGVFNPVLADTLYHEALHQVNFEALAPDIDWFKTSTAPEVGTDKTTTVTSFTKDYCPLFPAGAVVYCTDAAADDWTAVSAVFVGIDQFGDHITESVDSVDSGTVWTVVSTKAYQTLISVSITITGTTTSSDRYTIGFAKTYGLGHRIKAADELINSLFDGAADSGSLSIPHQTYLVAGTPDGVKALTFLIRPKPPYNK